MTFTDLTIIGIDETRPPMLQTRPCIDLNFELSDIASPDWCKEFQIGVGKQRYSFKIDPEEGKFIETWVREPGEIEKALELAQSLVARGNDLYRAMLKRQSGAPVETDTVVTITPAQQRLNDIVASLKFE